MTKADLIDKIAAAASLTKADAGKALDSTLDAIRLSLKKGQKVTLVGFGHSQFPSGKPERDATRGPARRSRSLQQKYLNSPLVKP